ncbi:zinc-containing alcohol dehydrogenase/quinone oxidoreductase [Tetragenococcus muriaticus PMC-11-5]|uniref:Zinc-containing alcohol dehydrogenase/quinone oxidoreductase n=1 Tax=Tetragenococcus muriaticus PMC-11-5 TaxID=1302649 RepID=A0A091CBW0_9ENTE|nr:NADP-dependent oxidoreductase [Tetragenococcus muriaticus]KFN89268.1 zinc-containing alcohol dehydrogenase/quinone oxidoreductase [Tetragenococcus muriaticus PMC-11-5]
MKAYAIENYGGPEALKEMEFPKPEVRDNDVLIEIENTGISPYDTNVREGSESSGDRIDYPMPFILGWNVSGFVREVGKNVTKVQVGDPVVATQDQDRHGGYAEYIAVDQRLVFKKPETLTFEEGATLGINGITVYQGLVEEAGISQGDRIMIHGGAGGIGIVAIQLAKSKGAYVYTSASPHNHDFLYELGADEVIDYNTTDFSEVLSDLDIVLDTRGGETLEKSFGVLRENGHLVALQGIDLDKAKARNVQGHLIITDLREDYFEKVVELFGNGTIKVHFDTIYPLSEVHQAHKHIDEGHGRGKLVLKNKA